MRQSITKPLVAAIAERRKALGIPICEMNCRVGESRYGHYVGRIERGVRNTVSLDELAELAEVVGLKVVVKLEAKS